MPKLPSTDPLLASLMQKSIIQVPSVDFDDKVMLCIEEELIKEKSVAKNVKISLLFFVLGTGFGLLISHLLPLLGESFAGIQMTKIVLAFQVIYILLILTQLDSLIQLFSKLKT